MSAVADREDGIHRHGQIHLLAGAGEQGVGADREPGEAVVAPKIGVIARFKRRRGVELVATRVAKHEPSGLVSHRKPALVNEAVVMATKEDEIVERGFAPMSPVTNVVRVDEASSLAAREATSLIALA